MSDKDKKKKCEKPKARKPPQIRQTLTSVYRMVKANPTWMNEKQKKDELKLDKMKLPPSVTMEYVPIAMSSRDSFNPSGKSFSITSKSLSKTQLNQSKKTEIKSNILTSSNASNTLRDKPKKAAVPIQEFKKPACHEPRPNIKNIKPVRRSLSAQHFNRKKLIAKSSIEEQVAKADVTQSLESIDKIGLSMVDECSPIKQEVATTITFKTPTAYKRRSNSFKTPTSMRKLGYQSTPGPGLHDLQRRLNDWLKKRGKPLSTFHHLKFFTKNTQINEETDDMENCENEDPLVDNISTMSHSKRIAVAKDALGDLNQLTIDGYPLMLCENWLGIIRQRYKEIEEDPQYWECRASIEQCRGNISSAVECFKTAIIKGAEVKTIDNSLDKLLEKFSLLNIEPNVETEKTNVMKEARNVFKSSIIQFAIQERKIKSNKDRGQNKYIVTPVRRSSRISMSYTAQSPAVKLCNSINDIDDSVKENMQFKGNSYLH